MKQFAHNISKYVLLLLFIGYYVNISFFTHSHVVNGVTIVHSHFYKQTADNKEQPKHSHSSSQIQLISVLSHYTSTSAVEASMLIPCHLPVYILPGIVIPDSEVVSTYFLGELSLRAPPIYY